MAWTGVIGIRGANGLVAPMLYNLVVEAVLPADQYAEAATGLDAIATEIDTITDGQIAYKRVTNTYDESAALGAGDVFEKLAISVFINEAGQAEKFATLNVPAPVIGVFEGTEGTARDRLLQSNTDVQDFVAAVADNATVSDGEEINTAQGSYGGIDDGRRVIVKRKLG